MAYGTLGLLFVAVSVGGTLTNFAAPPVLMMADAWGWTTSHMLTQFGWKAMLGILFASGSYYLFFRRELHQLRAAPAANKLEEHAELPIPIWVTVGHLLFMLSAIVNSHNPKQLIFVMLFFLAFVEVTEDFQRNCSLRPERAEPGWSVHSRQAFRRRHQCRGASGGGRAPNGDRPRMLPRLPLRRDRYYVSDSRRCSRETS